MNSKNVSIRLLIAFLSAQSFAQGQNFPPPPNPPTEGADLDGLPIDDWLIIMFLPALLLAFYFIYKTNKTNK